MILLLELVSCLANGRGLLESRISFSLRGHSDTVKSLKQHRDSFGTDSVHAGGSYDLSCGDFWYNDLSGPTLCIPRDHLGDTPLFRAMGFLVSQQGQLGAIPPPPFMSVSPLESMRSGGAIPPPSHKGVSQPYLRDTL